MSCIQDNIPPPSEEEATAALSLVLQACARNGLTALHNPGFIFWTLLHFLLFFIVGINLSLFVLESGLLRFYYSS